MRGYCVMGSFWKGYSRGMHVIPYYILPGMRLALTIPVKILDLQLCIIECNQATYSVLVSDLAQHVVG